MIWALPSTATPTAACWWTKKGEDHRRRQGHGRLRLRAEAPGKLSGNTVVATVMSNLGLHEYCRENGLDLVCTAVGDRHVLERMLADGFAIGGEQSGHTIFRAYATTGDGELTALQFLQTSPPQRRSLPGWPPAAPSIPRSSSTWMCPTRPVSRAHHGR